jgi:hypothetical protein
MLTWKMLGIAGKLEALGAATLKSVTKLLGLMAWMYWQMSCGHCNLGESTLWLMLSMHQLSDI